MCSPSGMNLAQHLDRLQHECAFDNDLAVGTVEVPIPGEPLRTPFRVCADHFNAPPAFWQHVIAELVRQRQVDREELLAVRRHEVQTGRRWLM